jgi:hypothetical protein
MLRRLALALTLLGAAPGPGTPGAVGVAAAAIPPFGPPAPPGSRVVYTYSWTRADVYEPSGLLNGYQWVANSSGQGYWQLLYSTTW